MKDTLTIRETAQRLGVAEQTVRRLIFNGDIPSIRISPRRIIVPVASFEAWLKERTTREA